MKKKKKRAPRTPRKGRPPVLLGLGSVNVCVRLRTDQIAYLDGTERSRSSTIRELIDAAMEGSC